MFIGASLMSDYFKSKVKKFIALAPIVKLDHNGEILFKVATKIDPTVMEKVV